jgi:hypothetical protein
LAKEFKQLFHPSMDWNPRNEARLYAKLYTKIKAIFAEVNRRKLRRQGTASKGEQVVEPDPVRERMAIERWKHIQHSIEHEPIYQRLKDFMERVAKEDHEKWLDFVKLMTKEGMGAFHAHDQIGMMKMFEVMFPMWHGQGYQEATDGRADILGRSADCGSVYKPMSVANLIVTSYLT